MPVSDLLTFILQFVRALFDPSAPLPNLWPTGVLGAFLVFASQIGAGIPVGVIMARDSGLTPLQTAGLYFASDVLLAVLSEPILLLLRWETRHVEWMGALGARLMQLSGATGLGRSRLRGPLGLILFSFVIAPLPARAVSETAGHGPISGWSLAIIGDMLYFGVVMASTLLVLHFFGEDRLVIAPLVIGAWLLPVMIQRLKSNQFRYDSTKH